eukprot:COSAG06_NODE_66093_length_255_cov_0.666667_1_plen_28_part_01
MPLCVCFIVHLALQLCNHVWRGNHQRRA